MAIITTSRQKYVVVGAGPVGSLAALYAAKRGYDVEIYELRGGKCKFHTSVIPRLVLVILDTVSCNVTNEMSISSIKFYTMRS